MALTLTEAQRLLLGIITSVESGVTSPEDAVDELSNLKGNATKSGLPFKADYTLKDFQAIQALSAATYDTSTEYVEPSYESSDSY